MGLRKILDEWTRKKLMDTVCYAVENSSFYKEKFRDFFESGLQIKTIEEFEKLPFTNQEELREHGMDFLCVKPSEISRIVTLDTGGTTGKPKRIYFTEEDQQLTVDYFRIGMQLMANAHDKVLILMPAKVPGSIGKLLAKGLGGFGSESIEYGLPDMGPHKNYEANMQEAKHIIDVIREEGVTGVVALPTHMELIAEAFEGYGSSVQWVLLSAEYVGDEQVELIEKTFNCKVYEHYGMTEMGLGCAVACGFGNGYHVREMDLYIEIIDPETGEGVPDGEVGEMVFTTLTRKGMPFIRYRTGDYSRWILDECQCGSVLKRLDKVGPRNMVKGYLRG